MTPAPGLPEIIDLSDSEPVLPTGWGLDDDDEFSMLSKRTRENETEILQHVDLRLHQRYGRSSRSNLKFCRKQAHSDADEVEKRIGSKPQKKIATQVGYKSARKEPPRSAARKMPIANADERRPKYARQQAYKSLRYQRQSSTESSARKTTLTNSTKHLAMKSPGLWTLAKDSFIPNLFRTFQLHTDSTSIFQEAKQLPFLLRNLRKSFKILCHNLGIPCTPLPDDKEGSVLICYEHLERASFENSLPKWFCPLCDLFGRFETREMLKVHLELAHKNIFFDWIQPADKERQDGVSWRLHVLFPEGDDNDTSTTPEIATPEPMQVSPLPQSTPNRRPTLSPHQRQVTASPATAPPQPPPQPKKPRPREYPRPPPSSNRLGPSARPPYLPAKSTFGGPDIYYSTRIDGPCLFDLLQLLPLKPFGLLEWIVLDREEEIFVDDELKDEQKVIMALWARWITLNKNKNALRFQGRANGVKMFIDEYWKMIHFAAGWQALVDQLVVLGANRLLKTREIAELITYYESLVGMDYWDEWDSEEE
ncbi:hypothetical protein F5887DRAFT_975638 [Amanita rubescens]|nr:hypothetical protein F5887DRAFT_975638 [Amanita rubescens]